MPAPRPTTGIWTSGAEDLVGAPVAPGVWVSALPFPNPLKYIFSYLVEAEDGIVVVDLGWNTDLAWSVFEDGLARIGRSVSDVSGVVITHAHPDHYGLASRLRASSDAWIAVHPAERPQIPLDNAGVSHRLVEMERWLRTCGAPDSEIEALHADAAEIRSTMSMVQPDIDLVDGVSVPGTRGSLVSVHTPGHNPGHVCFLDRERGVLFTGDHLLPRVTPNVSKRPTSDDDPLLDFEKSLRLVDELASTGPLTALPGHEWVFDSIHDRVVEVDAHHHERLDEMRLAVEGGCRTVWDVASTVRWSRPFATLEPRARRSAIGETYAHLYRLSSAGRLCHVHGVPEMWESLPALP